MYLVHRTLEEGGSEQVPVPWAEITADPSKFYDTEKFVFPLPLKDPRTLTSIETLMVMDFLKSTNDSAPFNFRCGVHIPSGQSESGVHSTDLLSGNTGGPGSPATTVVRSPSPEIHIPNQLDNIPPPQKSPSPHVSPVPSTPPPLPPSQPRKAPRKSANKRVR